MTTQRRPATRKRRYRVTVQREVMPGTWETCISISGPATDAKEALVRAAVAKNKQHTSAVDQSSPNYRAPNGQLPYYPNVRVKLSGTGMSPFNAVNRVRTAMKAAGVPSDERSKFSTEAIGGGLAAKVNGKDTIFETIHRWVTVT